MPKATPAIRMLAMGDRTGLMLAGIKLARKKITDQAKVASKRAKIAFQILGRFFPSPMWR